MIKGMRHVGIVVSDLSESLRFYRQNFGFTVVRTAMECGASLNAMLGAENVRVETVKLSRGPGCLIELLSFQSPASRVRERTIFDYGISHIALTVDDLNAEYRRLKLCGVRFLSPVQHSGSALVVFCQDPDGNFIELVEDRNLLRAA